MAADLEPEVLAKWTFIITMVGTVLFIGAAVLYAMN